MPSYTNNNSTKIINYINKDYNDLLDNLITFSRTYYPNTFNDFSQASPARVFMEMTSYVGDVLSFYLDNQVQENFLVSARQSNNIYNMAYMYGYTPKISNAASGDVEIFQQIPSLFNGTEYVPDYSFAVKVPQYTRLANNSGGGNGAYNYYTLNDVDFTVSSSFDPTEVTVYEVDQSGNPVFFLLKKTTKITAGNITSRTLNFNAYTPYPTKTIQVSDYLNMIDVVDQDGNSYYEVEYLGQETIFDKELNRSYIDPNKSQDVNDAPYVLSAIKTDRRYTVRIINNNTIQLQWGAGKYGNDGDENILPNQNNVGLGLPYEQKKLTTAYSPQNFIFTNSYGIAPSNTTLRIRMFTGGGFESNAPSNSVTVIDTTTVRYVNIPNDITLGNYIIGSLSCNNPAPLTGGRGSDSLNDIRQNTMASIGTQLRAVTLDDYIIRTLSMPSIYGRVDKVYAQKPQLTDQQTSTIETLNLFVLGRNKDRRLNYLSNTVKENIRTYLNEYKMVGDTVEIRDAFIINIGINFDIIVRPNYNNNVVLTNCITDLNVYFSISQWSINQPIYLRELYVLLDKVEGVQTVENIEIVNKVGETLGYSEYSYDIEGATINRIVYPALDPSIFEIRYPEIDINGRVIAF